MASVSHLGRRRRVRARRRARQAALLGANHRSVIHYTQSSRRWDGIRLHRTSRSGQYPNYADCSSFTTWCLWNALWVPHKIKDVVNGANWNYGYTGTQLNHGKPVRKWAHKRVGDLIHYRGHVAIYIGGGLVVSHGSEAGPLICRWNYRPVIAIRRYI